MKLEELQPDTTVRGIRPEALMIVVIVSWHGSDALGLVQSWPEIVRLALESATAGQGALFGKTEE